MRAIRSRILVLVLLFGQPQANDAKNLFEEIHQNILADTLREDTLRGVTISILRLPVASAQTPMAVSVLEGTWLRRAEPQLTLRESLANAPGIWTMGEANFAQDIRLAIRGFGARAAFGIRGIRLLLDGIPETTPDGQGQVDNLDLAVIERIEILRGSSGGLYGNASGGVISLRTEGVASQPALRLRLAGGSWGFQQGHVSFSARTRRQGLRFSLTHQRMKGYRDHSAMRATLLNARWEVRSRDSSVSIQTLLNYARSPQADDPGALTAEAVALNRRAAHPTNLRFRAGEAVEQGRIGLVVEKKWRKGHTSLARTYALYRNFENRLPFLPGGQVQLQRFVAGVGLQHSWTNSQVSFSTGFDLDYQSDHRQRFDNLDGQRSSLELKQREKFATAGLFAAARWSPNLRWNLSAGIRYDYVYLQASDEFLIDGDQSGQRSYPRVSPWVGLTRRIGQHFLLRASGATHFEVPTLSELSNNPTGGGGFNLGLSPQRTYTAEFGMQMGPSSRWVADLAFFWATTTGELTPFELPQTPGRLYYRNAGQTRRAGVELSWRARLHPLLLTELVWTLAEFRYDRFLTPAGDFGGRRLPGLPQHWGMLDVRYGGENGWFARAQVRYAGPYFADDANRIRIAPVTLLSGRMGYCWSGLHHSLELFAGVDNATNKAYFHLVRLNAAAGRFFEPAPVRTFLAGLSWEWKGHNPVRFSNSL
ncbi:MAG: TonB-dependent receptor [Saprospiraceae bacterium]|nr:TonB-dependent receptor [Saprospiraceae bacterium]MDW8484486.1 TonB-dependent receptor [Saprospiraceae bacterium]